MEDVEDVKQEQEAALEEEADEKEESEDPASQLQALQASYDELYDRYLRLAADFENYRRRNEKEREEVRKYAIERLALDLLEVVDNLERAKNAEESSLREGLSQIQKLFEQILNRHSITPIEAYNQPFDPSCHEAIACIPSDAEEGIVIEEVVRGYRLNDRILRCAKVVVSKGHESEKE
ncbi:MAG: nucleotide exchange factor GrpE [Methanoculleaceae archaeon]